MRKKRQRTMETSHWTSVQRGDACLPKLHRTEAKTKIGRREKAGSRQAGRQVEWQQRGEAGDELEYEVLYLWTGKEAAQNLRDESDGTRRCMATLAKTIKALYIPTRSLASGTPRVAQTVAPCACKARRALEPAQLLLLIRRRVTATHPRD